MVADQRVIIGTAGAADGISENQRALLYPGAVGVEPEPEREPKKLFHQPDKVSGAYPRLHRIIGSVRHPALPCFQRHIVAAE